MNTKQGIDLYSFSLMDFFDFLSVLNDLKILRALLVSLIIASISLVPSVAHSHKVNIFAYAEDDKIFTESYFNDGSPCKESIIQVYDPEGNELLKGKTNEEGLFSFKVPKKTDLRIVLTASMGHRAEYRMPASELPVVLHQKTEPPPLSPHPLKTEEPIPAKIEPSPLSLSSETAELISTKIEPSPFLEGKPGEIADQNNIRHDSNRPCMAFDPNQFRSMVEDAVVRSIEKRMKPLMNSMIHSIVKAQTTRVALRDIIGGIGYIFGIMGLILYFKKREK